MSKVLIAENVGEEAEALLAQAGLEVIDGKDWDRQQLERAIGDCEALLVRSATQVDEGLLQQADRLRVVARAGVGVDNIDLQAATGQGVVVVNAPESNTVTAAEHTIALMLSLARNIPQANQSMAEGKWERSKFSGMELSGKTLGLMGFGRIGQLVASRAKGLDMKVVAYDPYISDKKFKELGVQRADTPEEIYKAADIVSLHLPLTEETEEVINKQALEQMKPGAMLINAARGALIDDKALTGAVEGGHLRGAALDVYREEPLKDHPLQGNPKVIFTPHLGASTREATSRAGAQAAEQIILALHNKPLGHAVNLPAVSAEDQEALSGFPELCRDLGKLGAGLLGADSLEEIKVNYRGKIADRDCRALTGQVMVGALEGRVEEEVNQVSVYAVAENRGVEVEAGSSKSSRSFTDLVEVTLKGSGDSVTVAGTLLGKRKQPHLTSAWGRKFNLHLKSHLAVFRYQDIPGMIGQIGTVFGQYKINIDNAAVGGRVEEHADGQAVMILSTAAPVTQSVLDDVLKLDTVSDGRAVDL